MKLFCYGYVTTWSLVFSPPAFLFSFSVIRCCCLLYLWWYHKSPALEGPSLLEQWVMTSAPPSAITYKWGGCNSPLSYQSFSACCVEVTADSEKPPVARLPVSSVLCRQCCLRGVCLVVRFLEIGLGSRSGIPWSSFWSQDDRIAKLLTLAHVVRTPMRCVVSAYICMCFSAIVRYRTKWWCCVVVKINEFGGKLEKMLVVCCNIM